MAWVGDIAAEVAGLFAAFEHSTWDEQLDEWRARFLRTARRSPSRRLVAVATTCKRGHPRTPENTMHEPSTGWRRCLVCRRESNRKRKRL